MTTQNATPGRGYMYVEMNIKDPEGFKQYTALSAPAVHAAGGRYIVRGVRPEFLEGSGVDEGGLDNVRGVGLPGAFNCWGHAFARRGAAGG